MRVWDSDTSECKKFSTLHLAICFRMLQSAHTSGMCDISWSSDFFRDTFPCSGKQGYMRRNLLLYRIDRFCEPAFRINECEMRHTINSFGRMVDRLPWLSDGKCERVTSLGPAFFSVVGNKCLASNCMSVLV